MWHHGLCWVGFSVEQWHLPRLQLRLQVKALGSNLAEGCGIVQVGDSGGAAAGGEMIKKKKQAHSRTFQEDPSIFQKTSKDRVPSFEMGGTQGV